MMDKVIECEIAVGTNRGETIFLPRIPHYDRGDELPFTFIRRQFPIRLAFSVTINKGQGQENERVGIYLPQPVFAHGQLYTAFSRGKRASAVNIFIVDNDKGHPSTDPGPNSRHKLLVYINYFKPGTKPSSEGKRVTS